MKNVQLTAWITLWLLASSAPKAWAALRLAYLASSSGGGACASFGASLRGAMAGVTGLVWAVTALQGMKCLLIPATLK